MHYSNAGNMTPYLSRIGALRQEYEEKLRSLEETKNEKLRMLQELCDGQIVQHKGESEENIARLQKGYTDLQAQFESKILEMHRESESIQQKYVTDLEALEAGKTSEIEALISMSRIQFVDQFVVIVLSTSHVHESCLLSTSHVSYHCLVAGKTSEIEALMREHSAKTKELEKAHRLALLQMHDDDEEQAAKHEQVLTRSLLTYGGLFTGLF
jgi:hypothetical protein